MKKIYTLTFLFVLFLSANLFSQVPVMNPISGSAVACAAPSPASIYSTSASNSPISYSWSVTPSAGVLIGTPNASVTSISFPNSNATYTVSCSAMNGSGISTPVKFVVTVFETPTVTFSGNNSFCQGSSTNISASSTLLSASSTISYFWSPGTGLNTTLGPNVIANPSVPTTYTVTGTVGFCSNFSLITITPKANPTITTVVSSNPVCSGNSISMAGLGANSYNWSGGVINGVLFTPTVSGTYTVIGLAANGCTNSAMQTLTVVPYPIVTVSTNSAVICKGLSATLTLSGTASSYSLNLISSPTSVIVSPTITTTYTVTGSNAQGCITSATITQSVSSCAGIHNPTAPLVNGLSVYPNPSSDYLNLRSGKDETVSIINELGQLVRSIELSADTETTISGLANGMYYVISSNSKFKITVLQ